MGQAALGLAAIAVAVAGLASSVGGTFASYRDATANTGNQITAAAMFPAEVLSVPDVKQTAIRSATLYADPPQVSNVATIVSVIWQRCTTPTSGSCVSETTGPAYTLPGTSARDGTVVRVVYTLSTAGQTLVTASPFTQPIDSGGSSVNGAEAQVRGANHPAFTLPGTNPVVGTAYGVGSGSWSGLLPGLSRQWQRCDASGAACVTIAGATGSSYTPVAADRGRRLRVRVSAALLLAPTNWAETTDSGVVL